MDKMSQNKESNKNLKLIDKIGGEQALTMIVAQFYQYALSDDRFNSFWLKEGIDIPKLHETVVQYMVGRFGGPNNYKGKNMKQLHKDMPIQQVHFDIYWQHMKHALQDFQIPQDVIQQILKIVLQDKPDIVNTPS